MANEVVHLELNTTDVAGSKKFYKGLFDWKLEDMKMGPGMTYTMIKSGEKGIGGIQAKPMPEAPTAWLAYISVDDVNKTIAKAKKQGANIVVPHVDIPGMGSFGIFVDPFGAALAVWHAAPRAPAASKPAAKKPAAKKPAAKKPVAKKKK